MRSRSAVVVLALLFVGGYIVYPASASAATCGKKDPRSGKTVRGVLALDEGQSDTDKAFKQDTGHKTLPLIFKVNGCDLANNAPRPRLEVNPRKGSNELPRDGEAVSIKRVVPDGSTLEVFLDIDSGKFDPGSYGASVVLRAPYINSSRTPITVSRSEDTELIPAGIGALAALIGLLVYSLLQIVNQATLTVANAKRFVIGVIVVVGVVAGAFIGYLDYHDQVVWTFKDNWVATATAGFGGATGGVMAGLLGGVWKKKPAAQNKKGGQ